MKSFVEIKEKLRENSQKKVIAVAAAGDEDVLSAIKMAQESNLAEPLLFGDAEKIKAIAEKVGLSLSGINVINEPDPFQAAQKAVASIRAGEADIIMKGLIGTAGFLRAVLDKEKGLRTGNVLSHVAVFEIPALSRLLIITDVAMNIAPSLKEKVQIIDNSLIVARAMGISKAKVAAVCAVETVSQDMPATVDAAILAKMSERGQLGNVIVDGPLALDNAVSIESAKHKGINSPVAGIADIILMPDIEAGNVMYKTLVFLTDSANAGIVMGAKAPIVLTSRSDTAQAKLNSIALSILAAGR